MKFMLASTERKKMIISQLVSRIEISKWYKIHLEVNMDYEQFCEGGTICKVQLIFKAKQAVITVTVCFLFYHA